MQAARDGEIAGCGAAGWYNQIMPSPFTGMDPFLEPHWMDVHLMLISEARNALDRSLPGDLIASTGERVAVEAEEGKDHSLYPDVRIFEPPDGRTVRSSHGGVQ